ncbi:MAG: hypothetical protein ACP5D2_01520 [Candidatus Nanoarchaeia archaeon]
MGFKKAGYITLGAGALKAGQGYLLDASNALREDSLPSKCAFGASEILKYGAAGTAGYALSEVMEGGERLLKIPKAIRGLLPTAAFTLGAGALIHYSGNTFGLPESEGILQSTMNVLDTYKGELSKMLTWDPQANPVWLTGAFATATSALKFGKNLLKSITTREERVRQNENLEAKIA